VAEAVSGLSAVPDAVENIFCGAVPADRRPKVEKYLRDNLHLFDGRSVERCIGAVEKMLSARQSQRSSKRPCSLGEREDFLCSIIVPFSAPSGTMEALLGVAENTSPDILYECLISMGPETGEQHDWVNSLGGDVRVLHTGRTGLGYHYNFAARQAAGRYLCFLSPGWVPQKGWLEALVKQLEADAETGVAGGLAILPNGLLAHSGITLDANSSPTRLYHLLPATLPGAHRIRPMRAVQGCLLVRRETFLAAGGFDDGYRSQWCEVDLCLQAGLSGWKTVYTPESLFLCLSEPNDASDDDRLRFFAKWVGHLWPDQETHWKDDQLDLEKLSGLYQSVISGGDESSQILTS
jgi:GT2 family glycosyltransferase